MEENRRGFHNTASQGHDHNTGGQGRMAPGGGKHKHMAEPTNHGGVMHERGRMAEHEARVNAIRANRGGYHSEPAHVTQSKHGAEHHIREGGPLRPSETGKELD